MKALIRLLPVVLLLIVAVLSMFGIAMLYSTTADIYGEALLKRQGLWILLGICAAFAVYLVGYERISRWSPWLLGAVGLPLLYLAGVHVLDKLGVPTDILARFPLVGDGATRGAYRWLKFGPFSVQPSEFAKLGIILFLAHWYSSRPHYVESFKQGLLKPLGLVGGVVMLVFLGGSLSITAITGMVILGMLFTAGLRLRYFLIFLVAGLSLLFLALQVSPTRVERLTTYREPERFQNDETYQLWASQLALGSGHLKGVGFNRSHMKERYLPDSHTDFIMAIVGEELGFAGVASVMGLYVALLAASFGIAATASNRAGLMIAFGVGLSLGLHAYVNLGVVSGFLPTTGVTAPLISYGGSSMLATWLGIGLLVSVARAAVEEVAEEETEPEFSPDPTLIRLP